MRSTIVIDTGDRVVGTYHVETAKYFLYSGDAITSEAIPLIYAADEVNTFNGNNRDMRDLATFANHSSSEKLPIAGEHTDMLPKCWESNDMFGKSLQKCYVARFGKLPPDFGESYEEDNRRDVYMTLKLWELWKRGLLGASDHATTSAT